MAVVTQFQFRRGTASEWTSANPTLAAGELGFETDTGKAKIGNGATAWNSLAYSISGVTGDIEGVTAGTGLTGGGTSGTVTLSLATPVAVANGGTGITSFGTGVATWLGTPSSANLASAVTDETGSGALVFGTSPTISTPILTLDSTTSTTSGRIAFNATNDKLYVGDGSTAVEFAGSTIITNAQTGTTYTLVLTDKDKLIELNNGSAISLTVPTNSSVAFPVGSSIVLLQTGAGQVTVGGAGVTINGTPGLKLRAQWSSATLIKRATDTWVLIGDLSA